MTRRAMTDARKRRIHTRENGLCYHCKEPVPMFGPDVRYDHREGVWLKQRDEDEDVSPAHTTCDKPKTARDQGIIAHVKRLQIKNGLRAAKPKYKRPIPSRGFQPGHRPMPSRPFQKREVRP